MTADPRAVEIVREVLMSFFTAYAIPANITLDPDRVNRQATSWTDAILRGTVFAPGLLDALEAAGWSLLPPGGQTRTEWASHGGALVWGADEDQARREAAEGKGPLMSRTVHFGPWQPSDTPGEPA